MTAALVVLTLVVVTAARVSAGAGGEGGDHPIARVGDEVIRLRDVSPEIGLQIYRHEVDIYTLVKRAAEELLERRLLERAARERGMTIEALVESEIGKAAQPASDAEVEAYFGANPQAAGEPGARERVAHYLTEKRKIEHRLAFLERLRAEAGVEILIEPPEQPRIRLDVGNAPTRGPADAPVVLVHFASFASRRSARSVGHIRRLRDEHPGRLRWVHLHLPNERDEIGLMAAQLAVRAERAGRFWELHDRLFAADGRLSREQLDAAATELGIEPVRPGETVELARVKADIDVALRAGVTDEPVLFVNGLYFSPTFPYEKLAAIVATELGALASDPRPRGAP